MRVVNGALMRLLLQWQNTVVLIVLYLQPLFFFFTGLRLLATIFNSWYLVLFMMVRTDDILEYIYNKLKKKKKKSEKHVIAFCRITTNIILVCAELFLIRNNAIRIQEF